jgi:hypothetical protein
LHLTGEKLAIAQIDREYKSSEELDIHPSENKLSLTELNFLYIFSLIMTYFT